MSYRNTWRVVVLRVVVLLGCCTVGFMILSSCEHAPRSSPLQDDPWRDAPLHASDTVRIVLYDSATTRAVVTAGRAVIDEQRRMTLLDRSVFVRFYSTVSGLQTATLSANQAEINDATQDMVASGNVVFTSDSTATTLRTSNVLWNHQTQRLESEAAVEITTPREQISGVGFSSDQHLTNYRLYRVRGIRQSTPY